MSRAKTFVLLSVLSAALPAVVGCRSEAPVEKVTRVETKVLTTEGPVSLETAEVEVLGSAPASRPDSHRAALEDAFQKALDAVAGSQIPESAQKLNFLLNYGRVVNGAQTFVESYKVLREWEESNLWKVSARVRVLRKRITEAWDEVKALRDRASNPRFLVMLYEKDVYGRSTLFGPSQVAAEIYLLNLGLPLIDHARVVQVREEENTLMPKLTDPAELAREAGRYGVDLLIIGEVKATPAEIKTIYDRTQYYSSADCALRAVRVSDAVLIASAKAEALAGVSEADRAQGAAGAKAAAEAVADLSRQVLRTFALSRVQGESKTVVLGNTSFADASRFAQALRNHKDVVAVRHSSYVDRDAAMQVTVRPGINTVELLTGIPDFHFVVKESTAERIVGTLQ